CSRERSKIGCSYYSLGLWPQEIWASRFLRATRALTITPSRAKPKARVPVAPIQTRSRFTHVRNGRGLGRQRDQVRGGDELGHRREAGGEGMGLAAAFGAGNLQRTFNAIDDLCDDVYRIKMRLQDGLGNTHGYGRGAVSAGNLIRA